MNKRTPDIFRGRGTRGTTQRSGNIAQPNAINIWLDDERLPPDGWVWAKTAEQAIQLLQQHPVDRMSFDHDLGPEEAGTGYQVALWLAEHGRWPSSGVSLHSANVVGVKNMSAVIERYSPYGRPSGNRRHFGDCKPE